MAHPLNHAESSVRRFGGVIEDYLPIHNWLDESKAFHADIRHRALRHHAEGIFLCEKVFGIAITNAHGRRVPVRAVAEQHVFEDLGRIPAASDWLREIRFRAWMAGRTIEDMPKARSTTSAASSTATQVKTKRPASGAVSEEEQVVQEVKSASLKAGNKASLSKRGTSRRLR